MWRLGESGEIELAAVMDGCCCWFVVLIFGGCVVWAEDGNLTIRQTEGEGRWQLNSEFSVKGITQGNHDVWNLDSSRARRDSTVRAPVTRPTRCITEPDTSRNETSEPLSIIRWSLPQTTPTERASAPLVAPSEPASVH